MRHVIQELIDIEQSLLHCTSKIENEFFDIFK